MTICHETHQANLIEYKRKFVGGQGSGGGLMLNVGTGLSIDSDLSIGELRRASYVLDHSNKKLLMGLIEAMIFPFESGWNDYDLLDWIKENQPKTYKAVTKA